MSAVGILAVIICVCGGFAVDHGNFAVLVQPAEFIIILGAAASTLLIACSPSLLKSVIQGILGVMTTKGPTKEEYIEVLMCLYDVMKTGKGNMLGLEAHVENPEASEIFKKYPHVSGNHH